MILLSPNYTDREDVKYNDGFFKMCQIEEARNRNITEEFNLELINVLGKSMMELFNNYAPGFCA